MSPPTTLDQPTATRWRRMQDIAFASVLVAVGIALFVVRWIGQDELSRETAQRVCLSAMEREAGEVVELRETREIDGGYVVNATVPGQRLTCETTIQDGRVVTSVTSH